MQVMLVFAVVVVLPPSSEKQIISMMLMWMLVMEYETVKWISGVPTGFWQIISKQPGCILTWTW